jgi:hypothetical protein
MKVRDEAEARELAAHYREQSTIDRQLAERLRRLAARSLTALDGAAAVSGATALDYRADVYERRARRYDRRGRQRTHCGEDEVATHFALRVPCPDCHAARELFGGICAYCDGAGTVPRTKVD